MFYAEPTSFKGFLLRRGNLDAFVILCFFLLDGSHLLDPGSYRLSLEINGSFVGSPSLSLAGGGRGLFQADAPDVDVLAQTSL